MPRDGREAAAPCCFEERRAPWAWELSAALQKKGTSPVFDRGTVLASLVAATALGATSHARRVPRLRVAGKTLTGWLVIDMDATLVTAHSDKEGAAATCNR